ncbi:DUF2065 domain-containing protein [Amylibacter sp. SFDW26]|nr:DUF2065 domain-containing protein [Amylibacter sp. SFDW26]KAB7616368.1 DUF2065 domain-containing protein [Amylibacter sp. SFDW26]
MHDLLLGLGLVAVLEGLVFALAPLRFEDLLKAMQEMSVEKRRTLGVAIVALGVGLVWLAKNSL